MLLAFTACVVTDVDDTFPFLLFFVINSQQFFKHEFSETHVRTAKPFRYRSCLVCDTMIRELIVLDVPPQVSKFSFLRLHSVFVAVASTKRKKCENLNWRQLYSTDLPPPLNPNLCFLAFFLRFRCPRLAEKVPNWQSRRMESQQQSAGSAKHASLRPCFRYGEFGNISSKSTRIRHLGIPL